MKWNHSEYELVYPLRRRFCAKRIIDRAERGRAARRKLWDAVFGKAVAIAALWTLCGFVAWEMAVRANA
jgi:hypothetical protein